jgi:hypothetical protein
VFYITRHFSITTLASLSKWKISPFRQNAASIAALMLTTEVLVADIKEEEMKAAAGAGHGGMGGMY